MTSSVHPFLEIVHALGPSFRQRAPAHDREGSFVSENYRELKAHRGFSLAVPSELGGGGASHPETCDVLRALANYCPATALALSMHTHLVAAAVFRYRHGQPGEALLRKVAASELVLVSTGAGDWVDSVGRAERAPGGYRVSGVKRFCSGAPLGDVLITSAPFESPEGGAKVLHFPIPMRADGVRIRDDWDTLGMRATGSHSIELDQVFVPDEAIVLERPPGWHGVWNVIATVAPPIYMAPYVGIAERAAELARASVTREKADAVRVLALGEIENQLALLHMAFREMVEIANDYDVTPTLEHASRMLIRKTLAGNAARACVEKSVELVGGAAFYRSFGLERLLRDIQGAAFHPLPEKKQLLFTGRVALGLSPIA